MATKYTEAVLRPHVFYHAANDARCHRDIAVRAEVKLTSDYATQPLTFDMTTNKGKEDLTLFLKMLEIAYQRGKQGRSDELAGLLMGTR